MLKIWIFIIILVTGPVINSQKSFSQTVVALEEVPQVNVQEEIQKKSCLKDLNACRELAIKKYNAKELNQAFNYFSLICEHASWQDVEICNIAAEIGSRDYQLAKKARLLFKRGCDANNFLCLHQALAEEKLGNSLEADALYHRGCKSAFQCGRTIYYLDVFQKYKTAAELLRTCMALGGHPACLIPVAYREDNCIEARKLLEQACAYSKKDPTACKKRDQLAGETGTPKALYLEEACGIQYEAEKACEALKNHTHLHEKHTEQISGCAIGHDQSCNHLSRFFEISSPEYAKKIKCGFGEWSGCQELGAEASAGQCLKKLTIEERAKEDRRYPGRRNLKNDYSAMGEFESMECASKRQNMGFNCAKHKSNKTCLFFSKLNEMHRPELAKQFKCGFGDISGCHKIFIPQ
jgi:hypothetical protein